MTCRANQITRLAFSCEGFRSGFFSTGVAIHRVPPDAAGGKNRPSPGSPPLPADVCLADSWAHGTFCPVILRQRHRAGTS
jgi:hypothetical protein